VWVAIVTGVGVPVMAIIWDIAKCICHPNREKEKEPPAQTSLWLVKRTNGELTASEYSCKHSIISSHEKICLLVPRTIAFNVLRGKMFICWFIYLKYFNCVSTLNQRCTEDYDLSSINKMKCQNGMWKEAEGFEVEFVGSDLYDGNHSISA